MDDVGGDGSKVIIRLRAQLFNDMGFGLPRVSKISRRTLFAPGRLAVTYLAVTYIIFLTGPLAKDALDLVLLTFFVTVCYLSFGLGAYLSAYMLSRRRKIIDLQNGKLSPSQNMLIIIGSIYLIVLGANFAATFGVSSISDIVLKVLSPGSSYQEKFDVFEMMQDTNYVSRLVQVLTVFSLIYAAIVPFGAYAWRDLSAKQRSIFVLGIVVYGASFLAIGTMKGIGDLMIFTIVGLLARSASDALAEEGVSKKSSTGRRAFFIKFFIVSILILAGVYMISLQISRAQTFGITYSPIVGDVSTTLLAEVFGEDIAYGVYLVLGYPSHGYLGLSYNLNQPFEFAYGAGFSPAFESYRYQYFGGFPNKELVYLVRTEAATGWPAGMYWSTIFPWLASDLSFWGIPLFMFLWGWVLTKVWASCIISGSAISLAALGHLALAIAFIPSNNQVLSSRVGLWVLFSLIAIWIYNRAARSF